MERVIASFYVDDFSGGANSLDDVHELFKKLKLLFINGVFNLRKFRTNEPNLRRIIGDENPSSKTFGIVRNEKDDTLSFNFQEICDLALQLKPTKQNILKILSMFYDPTRILQPVIINLKITFQNICKQKIVWHDELPIDIANIINSLNDIQEIKIPRKIIFEDNLINLSNCTDLAMQAFRVTAHVFIYEPYTNRVIYLLI